MDLVTPHRELADAIPQLAWTTGPDGVVDWLSRRWVEYTGLRPEELLAGALWQAISPEAREGIDERLRRAAAKGEPGQRGGLGLGLALSRSLAELHGGTVTAHSEGQGRGSEFVLRLPLCPRGAESPTETAAAP